MKVFSWLIHKDTVVFILFPSLTNTCSLTVHLSLDIVISSTLTKQHISSRPCIHPDPRLKLAPPPHALPSVFNRYSQTYTPSPCNAALPSLAKKVDLEMSLFLSIPGRPIP